MSAGVTSVKMNGGKATITGNLTLHGVTKEIEIEAEPVGGGEDPWGGYRQGFTGTTKIALKDFGINYDLLWQTIRNRIPQIKPVISQILKDLAQ